VTPVADVYTEELFGPVLAVVRVPTLDDAIELINANPYGTALRSSVRAVTPPGGFSVVHTSG
jgi:acyl-CoA reductase-like NAD-dependent aldehyde dehydrogenase